jgi:ligand-binding sensor domain-containing protein
MKIFLLFVSAIVLLFSSSSVGLAQKIESPLGQPVLDCINLPVFNDTIYTYEVVTTLKKVAFYYKRIGNVERHLIDSYTLYGDRTIVTSFIKYGDKFYQGVLLYVLLSDGSIITFRKSYTSNFPTDSLERKYYSKSSQLLSKEGIIDANGDDLYAISNKSCYISRDSGDTWTMDTAGLSNSTMYKLTLDSNQRVYLATSKGLFTQELISSQWKKNSAFPETSCTFVYVDKKQRVWAFGGGKMYVSTDFGSTFSLAPSGVPPSVKSMTDDSFGNVYAIAGRKIVKSAGGTATFEEIQQGIEKELFEGITSLTLNKISGGSSLFVATNVGLFTSYDQGKTWEYFGVEAESNFGLVISNIGDLIVSNNMGIFKNTNNSTWTKVFPTTSYGKFEKIFKDTKGVLYTTSQANKLIWKSVDNGTTWQIDTIGYSTVRNVPFNFYVDDEGTMYAFVNGTPSLVYSKKAGNSWLLDTLGFKTANNSLCTAWGTDKDGYIYIATTSNYLQKRLKTGGAWITDTAGLINNAIIYDMAVEPNGILWAGTYIGAFKRINGRWTQLAYPPGTNGSFTNSCFALSVDGAGAVWTQWTIFTTQGNAIGTGLYYTLDGGKAWTSKNIDTITFRQLVSIGDTTYGVSYVDGLFKFTRKTSSTVETPDNEILDIVYVYPNPTNQFLNISTQDGVFGEITIFDEIGRIVLVKNSDKSERITIDISSLPNGAYSIKIGSKFAKFIKN